MMRALSTRKKTWASIRTALRPLLQVLLRLYLTGRCAPSHCARSLQEKRKPLIAPWETCVSSKECANHLSAWCAGTLLHVDIHCFLFNIAELVFGGCCAQRLLVCGWGETPFMVDLLRELDAGTGALPRGSEVILLNAHAEERIAGHLDAIRNPNLGSIRVRHVKGNPLCRDSFAKARSLPLCIHTGLIPTNWAGHMPASCTVLRPGVSRLRIRAGWQGSLACATGAKACGFAHGRYACKVLGRGYGRLMVW